MVGFKDIPQSLIDAVQAIIEDDKKEELKQENKEVDAHEYEMHETGLLPGVRDVEEGNCPGCEHPAAECVCPAEDCGVPHKQEEEKGEVELAAGIHENVSIDSDDLASPEPRSALGQRNSEMPKHVDVVKEDDFRPLAAGGSRTEGFRLLLQYSTNSRPVFVPSLDLPAAPTLEALSAMIPGSAEVVEAISNALNLPHLRPAYKGNDEK